MQRTSVKSALVGRLLSEHGFAEHPSYADVPIERPIFVCGLPRTGTTALHRLLHADPTHQGLELWLTEVPQPRPPRETWADNPVFRRAQPGLLRAPRREPRVHGHPLHGRRQRRGVLADPAPVGQVDRLRVAGPRAGVLRLAGAAGLDRRLPAAQGQPAADRARRPGQAVGAEEPLPPRRAGRDHGGLPGRAGRADPPRPGRRHRVRVLAVGGGDARLVDDVRRRDHRPHPAGHAEQGGGPVRARAGTPRRRSSSPTSTTASSSPTRSAPRRGSTTVRPGVDPRGRRGRHARSTPSHGRAGADPSTPTTWATTASPRTRSAPRSELPGVRNRGRAPSRPGWRRTPNRRARA